MNNEANPLVRTLSADCQWSRHILCLASADCGCKCHADKGPKKWEPLQPPPVWDFIRERNSQGDVR
jgi:hypothetical protein